MEFRNMVIRYFFMVGLFEIEFKVRGDEYVEVFYDGLNI